MINFTKVINEVAKYHPATAKWIEVNQERMVEGLVHFNEFCGWDNQWYSHEDWAGCRIGNTNEAIFVSPNGRIAHCFEIGGNWVTDNCSSGERFCFSRLEEVERILAWNKLRAEISIAKESKVINISYGQQNGEWSFSPLSGTMLNTTRYTEDPYHRFMLTKESSLKELENAMVYLTAITLNAMGV